VVLAQWAFSVQPFVRGKLMRGPPVASHHLSLIKNYKDYALKTQKVKENLGIMGLWGK